MPLRYAAAWRALDRIPVRRGAPGAAVLRLAMTELTKKRWVRAAEVALAVVIVVLLVATLLPAIIGANPPGAR